MRNETLRFFIDGSGLRFFSETQGRAQNPPLKKINWGMTALSAAMWIPWIAKDAKIYEKNGLDVDIVLLRGSGQSSQALLGGSLFAAPVALPQLMLADLNGADLVNVAHTIATASSKLLVKHTFDGRKICAARRLRPPASARWAIFYFATRCASTASTPIAKSPGSRSAPTPNGCKLC